MGRFGMSELLIVLGIILLFFGPSKLPSLAKSVGQAVREFKAGAKEIGKELEAADEEVKETVSKDK